jgi:hypothetical protein
MLHGARWPKREVAVLYLEGGPDRKSSHLLKKMTSEQGKRMVLDSLKRSMQVDDWTAQYYLSISNGDPRAALSEFSEDLKNGRGKRAWPSFSNTVQLCYLGTWKHIINGEDWPRHDGYCSPLSRRSP